MNEAPVSLVSRRNSLNLIRLVLAVSVIVSHNWPLGGFGGDPHVHGLKLGTFAVGGFFCISGYLIAQSRNGSTFGRFLWHRVLRIMPAYWVTLLLVALVFAPITWMKLHGGLEGYPAGNAARFGLEDSALFQHRSGIEGTVVNWFGDWIGALWTLPYEFACYLMVGGAASLGWLGRRHPAIPLLTTTVCVLLALNLIPGRVLAAGHLGLTVGWMLTWGVYFAAGSSLYVFRDLVPRNKWIALGAFATGLGSVWFMTTPHPVLCWALAYFVLWLGNALPSPEWVKHNDLSYGTYLYGWPIAQVLITLGLAEAGRWILLLGTLSVVAALAWLSLRLVEKPALRLKEWNAAKSRSDRQVPLMSST